MATTKQTPFSYWNQGKDPAKKDFDSKYEEARKSGALYFDSNERGEKMWESLGNSQERLVTGLGDNKDEDLVQIETPSGGLISARGKGLEANLNAANSREYERLAKAKEFQETLANNRRERAMNRLTDSGYDWRSEDSAALFNPDGTLNTSKAKTAADRAEGLKARATFEAWDNDKELQRRAVAMEKNARSERSYLMRAQRGAYGLQAQREAQSPEGRARIAKLDSDLSAGEANRGGLEAGFWREEAEKVDAARTERRAAVMNLEKADLAKAKSLAENSTNIEQAMKQLYEQLLSGNLTPEQAEQIRSYFVDYFGEGTNS